MASPVGAVARLVVKTWPLLVKYGPKVVAALPLVTKFVKDHPDVPNWFRDRMNAVPKRLVAIQGRVGTAAKITGTLDLIRDVARDAEQAETSFSAAPWVGRADDIALGVRLAEKQDRPKQKETLAGLKGRTDDLLADLLEHVARLHAPESSAG
jgi:hypothetical protein